MDNEPTFWSREDAVEVFLATQSDEAPEDAEAVAGAMSNAELLEAINLPSDEISDPDPIAGRFLYGWNKI